MEQYDIIIIGAGPGGLTAGIYAGRQGTKNLIIDRDLAGGLGREVPEMENYPGFDNISGLELIEKMKSQATKNCDLHEIEEVIEITENDTEYRFTVTTNKEKYRSKSIILATGSSHRHLNAKGEEEYKGKCSYHDDGRFIVSLDNDDDKKRVMYDIVGKYDVDEIKVYEPSLNDIFVEYAKDRV